MRVSILLSFLIFFTLSATNNSAFAQTNEQARRIVANYDSNQLTTLANSVRRSQALELQKARRAGFRMTFEVKESPRGVEAAPIVGYFAKLQGITEEETPLYYRTLNAAAARSTRTHLIRNSTDIGIPLTGRNLTA